MKTVERVQIFINHKGLKLKTFDSSINASNGYIGKQIKNKASIGSDVIEKIIEVYTDINLIWLITGNGEMLLNKANELSVEEKAPVVVELQTEKCLEFQNRIKHLEELLSSRESELKMAHDFVLVLKEKIASLEEKTVSLEKTIETTESFNSQNNRSKSA